MFWMQYVEMMHLYRELTRSIRVGDIDAYIESLPKFSNYFFKLFKMDCALIIIICYYSKKLIIRCMLSSEWVCFLSGEQAKLTLEQIINNDAASQRSSISSLTNSISARQRWAESYYLTISIINDVS